jgi:hypothetical protein
MSKVGSGRWQAGNGELSRWSTVCKWPKPEMEREHLLDLRVGLRIRCAGQARVDERCVGCEADEGHIRKANAEGATAAVMRYGYRRGELFEGCETH